MQKRLIHGYGWIALSALAALPAAQPAFSTELKQKSLDTFSRYIQLTEHRVNSEVAGKDGFLWPDSLPEVQRAQTIEKLKRGEVVVAPLKTLDNSKEISDGDALIHHWVGVVFVPEVRLQDALAVVQDYSRHAEYYKPDVALSEILEHQGDCFRVHVRFLKTKVLTAVLDTEHEICYLRQDSRAHMRSVATRIQEVEDPGQSSERLLPPGKDRGFMWRFNNYWRFEERDGGVYIQCESITLTRDIPFGFDWLIGRFVKSIPRESLTFTLGTTRRLTENRRK
jgi:hypothetical protein